MSKKEKKYQQQELIDKLKDMPEVQDKRNKEEVYSQISSRLIEKDEETNKKKRFIPFASAAAAALLFIIFLPVLFNTDMQQTSENDTINQASDMDVEEANENNDIQYNQESSEGTNEESNLTEQETSIMETENESLVVQDINQNEHRYFAGLSDVQEQYIIPITFISSGEQDLQSFYNNMEEHLSEWEKNTGEFLFENVEFQINQSDNEVALEVPDDFSFAGSSARANMFEYMLATMFRPYGTEKVTLHTDDGEPAVLDPFGEINELPLRQIKPSSYKLRS